ncbi:MAG TPA: PspC domain-containing protein [Bryobacteraceae bacterium]|jgi:phage shock protein C|nr:PspC domain-containing protein [Bryobacteraceae bacterium]
MYCTSCGIELPDSHRYCHQCGTATGNTGFTSPTGEPGMRLTRPMAEKKIAGVCAGIARYFGIDVTLVRIIMVCLAFWPPSVGLILYIVCWIVMPKDPLLLPPPHVSQGNAAVAN